MSLTLWGAEGKSEGMHIVPQLVSEGMQMVLRPAWTAHVSDRVESFESSVGVGLGNRFYRMEVAIQNLTQYMANLVESKSQARIQAGALPGRPPPP